MPEYEEPVLVLVLDCKLLFDKLYSKRMAPILGNKSYSLRVGLVMLYVHFFFPFFSFCYCILTTCFHDFILKEGTWCHTLSIRMEWFILGFCGLLFDKIIYILSWF